MATALIRAVRTWTAQEMRLREYRPARTVHCASRMQIVFILRQDRARNEEPRMQRFYFLQISDIIFKNRDIVCV